MNFDESGEERQARMPVLPGTVVRFDAGRQIPASVREARTLEDSQGGFQADGVPGVWISHKVLESFQRAEGQLAHLVLQSFHKFKLGVFHGGFELRIAPEPVMNGGSVDTSLLGRGSDAKPLSKGGDYLDLCR